MLRTARNLDTQSGHAPPADAPSSRPARRRGYSCTDSKHRKTEEQALVLTTEFNYNYRILDGVWAPYYEGERTAPLLTPVLITKQASASKLLSPVHHPEVCEVGALYLYNTRYIQDTKMDYDYLIPECMIGTAASR